MIRVTVELLSAIHPSRNRRLGTLDIANDGSGGKTLRNYNATFRGPRGRPGKQGRIVGYPAEQVAIWNLIRRACEEAGYKK